jgi:flagellar protein FlaG
MEILATGVPAPSGDPPTSGIANGRLLPNAEAPKTQPSKSPSAVEAVKRANEAAQAAGKQVQFSYDAELDTVVVKVLDGGTQEVIRQFPSEEMVQISKSIRQMQGLLLSIRV